MPILLWLLGIPLPIILTFDLRFIIEETDMSSPSRRAASSGGHSNRRKNRPTSAVSWAAVSRRRGVVNTLAFGARSARTRRGNWPRLHLAMGRRLFGNELHGLVALYG